MPNEEGKKLIKINNSYVDPATKIAATTTSRIMNLRVIVNTWTQLCFEDMQAQDLVRCSLDQWMKKNRDEKQEVCKEPYQEELTLRIKGENINNVK